MRFTDCFMELFAYVIGFRKTANEKQPPYEQVKEDINRLLAKTEECVKQGVFTQDDFNQARYPVCAWIDESILASTWTHRGLWPRDLLQRRFYNSAEAGEKFFERLNGLGAQQKEIREVYYMCLALGFKGRYVGNEASALDQLKITNLKQLFGSSVGVPSIDKVELFPDAYPERTAPTGPKKWNSRYPMIMIAAVGGPIFLFTVLFLVYRFTLYGVGESILKAVR